MISKITIKGRIPSLKNSRNCFVRGGRMINIPSKQYSAFHKEALKHMPKSPRNIEKVHSMKLDFWAPDKRAGDLDNKTASIMDLLVDANVLKDDNWYIVPRIILVFMGVDKENPRVELTIYHA